MRGFMNAWWIAIFCGAVGLAGCSNDGDGDGMDMDSGVDAGDTMDAGDDAGDTMEAGPDGEMGDDGGGGGDAGLVIHDCDDFDDRSASGADRTVEFGSAVPTAMFSYTPKCMLIATGQEVTFSGGDFGFHPLRPGVAPSRTGDPSGSSGNPIMDTSSGSTASFTFDQAGTFPYYCDNHHATNDMFGVIRVQE